MKIENSLVNIREKVCLYVTLALTLFIFVKINFIFLNSFNLSFI